MNIKELEKTVVVNGETYTLDEVLVLTGERNPKYVYVQWESFKELPDKIEGKDVLYIYKGSGGYELFERKILKVTGFRSDSEKYRGFTHFVKYPSDSDFGSWAWSDEQKGLLKAHYKIITKKV